MEFSDVTQFGLFILDLLIDYTVLVNHLKLGLFNLLHVCIKIASDSDSDNDNE